MKIHNDLKKAQKENSNLKNLPIKTYKTDISELSVFFENVEKIDIPQKAKEILHSN